MFSSGSHSWDGLIVLCAGNNYDTIKVADQHLADELAKLAPVLYIDPPVSCLTPLRDRTQVRMLWRPRLRLQAPNFARLTPIVAPFPARYGMTDLTTSLLHKYIRQAVAKLRPGNVSAMISAWPHYSIFGAAQEDVSLYWAQDDFVGGADLLGIDGKQLAEREGRVAASADLVVAANPLIAETWRGKGYETLLIPFGAVVSAYASVDSAPLPEDVSLPDPIVGFVGQINARIDIRLLEAVVDRGLSLLLVGPREPTFEPARFDALLRRANVCWVGYKEFGQLPSYYRRMTVGVVPYGDSAFNRASFPLKTLEYLAAGMPVVSTDLPATRWLATDLIGIASEPGPFVEQVERMLGEADERSLIERRREFSARHSYAMRACEFYAAVRDYQGRRQSKNPSVHGA